MGDRRPTASLVQPNAWVGTSQLIESIWPEQAVPATAKANLDGRHGPAVSAPSSIGGVMTLHPPTTRRGRYLPARSGRLAVLPTRGAQQMVLSTPAGVDATLAAAGRDVLVSSTMRAFPDEPIGLVRRIDHENLRRGVRYRLLFPDRAREVPALALRLGRLALAGAEVRTAPDVPVDAIVIDEALTVLPGHRHDGRPGGVAMVRLPSVVSPIVELFERVWPSAVPLTGSGVPHRAELTGRDRELLALLSAGFTDEAAAARLGISVRTVRRMMSTIMTRLGARSRFQAGIKAADRGWLVERAG